MENFKIAFLLKYEISKYQHDNDAILGAVLVTDKDTKPLEFRITEPVCPTKYQKVLYGEIINDYILVELIAIPLLAALTEKPNIVLVREKIFLDVNNKQAIPVFQLLKDSEAIVAKQIPTQEIISPGGKFNRIRITNILELEHQLLDIKNQLEQIYASRDLLEPFNRLRAACEQRNTL